MGEGSLRGSPQPEPGCPGSFVEGQGLLEKDVDASDSLSERALGRSHARLVLAKINLPTDRGTRLHGGVLRTRWPRLSSTRSTIRGAVL